MPSEENISEFNFMSILNISKATREANYQNAKFLIVIQQMLCTQQILNENSVS